MSPPSRRAGAPSIATAIGLLTLFGAAARHSVLLVSRYEPLLTEEVPLSEAVLRGPDERRVPVPTTASTATLALVPLVLGSGNPGNEIDNPTAQVILGGLLTSTLLNLVLMPALIAGTRLADPAGNGRA